MGRKGMDLMIGAASQLHKQRTRPPPGENHLYVRWPDRIFGSQGGKDHWLVEDPMEDAIGIVPRADQVRLQAIAQHHVVAAFTLPSDFTLDGPRGPLRTALRRKVTPLPRFPIPLAGPEAKSKDPPP